MLTGGCFCGQVRYEAHGTPYHPVICHCADCRRACGAPTVAWFTVRVEDFRVTKGAPATWHSSPGVTRGFCGRCGTQLTFQHADLAYEIDVTTASLDDPAAVPPADHVHAASRLPWVPLDDLPVYPGGRADGSADS